MSKIYLSSTFEDLKAYRDAVYRVLRQLRHDVVSMEDYVASPQRPLDKCLADVAACQAYVGLFAWRRGFIPPGQALSITELELREAERHDLPRLVFLLADEAPWPAELKDADLGAIRALREALRTRYTVQFFHNPDELARQVATSVANLWQGEAGEAAEPTAEDIGLYRNCVGRFASELERDIRFYALATAVLIGAAAVALGVALAAMQDTPQLLLGAGALVFASTSPFPVVTMRATRKKKALLDGYVDELRKDRPPRAAVQAVRRFVESQLVQVGAA
ncbi:DUF4062 domain-containing protein [uncultured Piscinibacter sp.]|uniref:DUF4062 domain-containing protein n=1 Tax=uncultured Piscinibacter sp. TaxID=1131835 RepID=UPI00262A2BF0|nr:DUF4062 domain-containing protein [uncultured Piscinibacter sp.]